jgi:RNA polymerase sigma factor (sigma-70 family)
MEARSETDIQIADQLLADDPAALSQVLASYCPDIQRVLRTRFTPELNEQDIEDALSLALSRLWFVRHQYDPQAGSLRNFFFVIAKNLAIDLLRAKARQSSLLKQVAFPVAEEPAHVTAEMASRSPESLVSAERDWQKQALAESLEEFGAVDRQILLAYAHARGGEHWAAEVAAEVGLPAGTVRVRRGRLMERLRRKMTAFRENRRSHVRGTIDMEGALERKSDTDATSTHALEAIEKDVYSHREQLADVLEAIRRHSATELAEERAAPDSPLNFFKHLWNRAADEGTLDNSPDREQLRAVGGWMQEIEREDEKFRTSARRLLERAFSPPSGFRALVRRRPIDVEQVERSLMGVSQAFRRAMPDETAERGRGLLLVALGHDRAFWSDDEAHAFPLQETVGNAISYHGKVGRPDAARSLCEAIVHDLRAGDVYLPAFTQDAAHSNRHHAAYEWRLPMLEPQEVEAPDKRGRYTVAPLAPPRTLELNLREKYPAVADLIDDAVSAVLKAEAAKARTGRGHVHEESALNGLIEQIDHATGHKYSHAEIAGLILPFADARWAQANDDAAPALEDAMQFLAEELNRG